MAIEGGIPSVREASRSSLTDRPDSELPVIAAHWLADGLDSPELRALAGLGRSEAAAEARRLLPGVMRSLGSPLITSDNPWTDLPWRGCWGEILWARREIGHKLSALAAAQRVVETVGDVPELWQPGHGRELSHLIDRWQSDPDARPAVEQEIVTLLGTLSEEDVPALET